MTKQVMVRAWEIAKDAVQQFGGRTREYFAMSLSLAWQEVKNTTVQEFDAATIQLAASKGKLAVVAVPSALGLNVVSCINNVLNPVQQHTRNGIEYNMYGIHTDGRYGEFFTTGDGFWRTFKVDLKNRTIYYNGGTKQCKKQTA